MKKILMLCAMVTATAWSQPSSVQPDAFAHHARIDLTDAGPFHQLALPLAVYQGVQRHDLGDLRVFNGRGEVVPHTLLRTEAGTVAHVEETALPLFPIISPQENRGDVSVEVRRNDDGTLVSIRQTQAPSNNPTLVRGAILDASRLPSGGLRRLRLEIGATTIPFHPFTLETSNDLQHWRLLKNDAQLVHLEHAGQRIEKNVFEWHSDAGKYLRILWAAPGQAPAITAAIAGRTRTSSNPAPMLWTGAIAPERMQKDVYDFALPGHIPLEQLRIELPQSNTLVPLQIQEYVEGTSRRHRGGWDSLKQTVVFRLQSPQGEVRSPEIVMNRPAVHRLRLAVDGRSGGLGAGTPTVQIGFVPHILVFLARGEGPFSLAWSAPSVPNASLSPSTLIPGYRSDQKLSASPAVLQSTEVQGAASSTPESTSASTSKIGSKGLLWAVLIAGVLVLAGMAWALVKQMKQKERPSA